MYNDILLAIDINNPKTQAKAVETAVRFAKMESATLHVITVVPSFGMSIVGSYFPEGFETKAIESTRQHLHDYTKAHIPTEIPLQHIVAHGTIYEEILKAAREQSVDLIVMASHRPELSDYLLGPNAARVVRHADCSVMVVRDDED